MSVYTIYAFTNTHQIVVKPLCSREILKAFSNSQMPLAYVGRTVADRLDELCHGSFIMRQTLEGKGRNDV